MENSEKNGFIKNHIKIKLFVRRPTRHESYKLSYFFVNLAKNVKKINNFGVAAHKWHHFLTGYAINLGVFIKYVGTPIYKGVKDSLT